MTLGCACFGGMYVKSSLFCTLKEIQDFKSYVMDTTEYGSVLVMRT